MFKRFYPDMYIDSAYDIDYKGLYDKGYRGIIFDVDNTLVEHGAPVTERAKKLFGDLKAMGYNTCIISNNKEYRVKPLADEVGSLYVSKAGKPSPKNYLYLLVLVYRLYKNRLNSCPVSTPHICEQLIPHKICVRLISIHILHSFNIILRRWLEWIVLHFYKKHIKREGGKAGF